jgi:hypothetical protein
LLGLDTILAGEGDREHVPTWPGEGDAALDERIIRYDEVVQVDRLGATAEVIAVYGVSMYADDQPEMFKKVPGNVGVMLFRNDGNYDFGDQRWMLSQQTGKLVC